MAIVGLKQLRNDPDALARRARRGERITIVKRSKPLFTIGPVDDADEGWETVADFTNIRRGGVPAGELLKRLKQIDG